MNIGSFTKKNIFVVFVLLASNIVYLYAGPFGLDMGMSIGKIEEITGIKPEYKEDNVYYITPPKPYSLFDTYVVKISAKTGLYSIKAISRVIETSVYGTELKSKFTDLVGSIEKTYKKYKLLDYLEYKSIWHEPNDFMMGMLEKERSLLAFWDKDEESSLTKDIVQITVAAYPLSTAKGFLVLEYSFINEADAEKELKDKEDSVF